MKNIYHLLLICMLGSLSQYSVAQPICGFDAANAKRMKADPEYRQKVQAGETSIRNYIRLHPELMIRRSATPKTVTGGNGRPQTLSGSYLIPVVIHVINTGGDIGTIYNPSDAQLLGAIDYLNEVYNGTWPGTVTTGYGAGNLGIQFVLAQRDPNCNPTNGINRVNGSAVPGYTAGGVNSSTTLGTDEINIKNLSRWDNTQYYNIWVVNKIDGNDGTSGQFVAGYAYLPGAPSTLDGIVMLATQMIAGQKTLPHEIGHAFWLYHPFQGSADVSQCPANNDCTTDGDQVCDTDPISENINSGTGVIDFTCRTTPAGNINSCTGTPYTDATESNYMNYTNCYSLFTPGQAARMQATAVSPYRASLTTSLGGTPPSSGTGCTPKIDFQLQGDRKTEATTATTGCRSYTDYTYYMTIGIAPSATATATLTVSSGTAAQGLDFDISTNGSFTTPSQQLSFPAGSTTSQPFTIRIYDDASVNGTRTAILGFTVNNGGGNATAGDGRPNFTLTIDDNDKAPSAGVAPNGTISLGTLIGSSNSAPFDATQSAERTQFLYKASELTAAGVPAGTISGLSINITAKNSTRPYTNLYIKLGTSTAAYLFNSGLVTTGSSMTVVKSLASYKTTAGWNNFSFDSPFTWDGTSNLIVEICYDNGGAASSDAADNTGFYSDGGGAQQGNIFWQDNLMCWENFSSLSGVYGSGDKPQIRFAYGTAPTAVQSTLNASQTQDLGPNADVYFYDQTNGLLMARIRNLSSFDYGCTQMLIDRAGTSATQFWNTNTANYLMDKTFHVLPATNNASGSYNLTLYYTQAEVQGWQTFTGQSLSSIQLVKTQGQISAVTVSNPSGAGTATVVTPTIGSLGTNTSLSYNFTTGFSGFGAGVPSTIDLPIGLLQFSGQLKGDNAVLTWSTSYEQNNAGFEIDRSADGTHFLKIGFVTGAGNSSAQTDYTFTDPSLTSDSNYYQLKQTDLDGRFTYSKVVLIRGPRIVPGLAIVPDPFTSDLDILFGHVQSGRVEIRLLDITGRVRWRQTGIQSDGSRLHLELSGTHLSAGVYFVEVRSDNGTRVQRVLKE